MLLILWNYLKGYVIIEISGFSIERFLNLAVHNSINIDNLKETKFGVSCKISISNFKKLKPFIKKTKCKVKIQKRVGLPFILFKNRKRKVFCGGLVFFVLFLLYLSSFIWSIEVVGNEYIDNNEILRFCEENGFYLGVYKKKVKTKELETLLKNNFDTLSWITIQVKGTSATIKLAENIQELQKIENTYENTNIVAKSDAIITEIVTRSGTPLVKEKDIVKAGDVLVSGALFIKEGEEIKGVRFVTSDADIRAKSWYNITIDVPFEYFVKEYTGKVKTSFEFIAFNKIFNLDFIKNNISNQNYDKISSRKQLKLSEDFLLPFMLITHKYKEYELIKKTYTLEEAKEKANSLVTEKIISEFDFYSDILEKSISFEEYEDKLVATVNLTVIQDIGVSQEISEDEKMERRLEFGTKEDTNTQ